ncbi:7TM diverse intracellular signaling domain-containing protein [Microscilla marina]|uniref:Serine/threonine protein kinases, putative n=1 Tax=Microscilla marina ATCC 23134 TaxID=313606 RepID=A1ZH59_MICM2|nr:7TM diverse intracellular signaling domain-containing protein [Microscilla marina]EAY30328.1 serine/threonine protein kinases, putative [Microscilla marina ATCC 23134]
MQYLKYLCFSLYLLLAYDAKAQKVFYIEGDSNQYKQLNSCLYVLSKNAASFSFTQVQNLPDTQFQLFASARENIKKVSTVWGKIKIQSKQSHDFNGILILGKRYINIAEVYQQNDQGEVVLKKTGGHVRGSEKDLNINRTIPKVRLYLKPGQTKTIYIRFQNVNQKNLSIGLEAQTKEHWDSFIQRRNLVQGIFQGAVGLILLYNLFLYVLSGNKIYVYYSGYLFCTGAYFFNYAGFSTEYLFPEYPHLFYDVYLFSTVFLQVFYIQFIRVFLNTQKNIPFWDKVMCWWMVGRIIEFLVLEAVLHTSDNFAFIHNFHRQYALVESAFFLVLVMVWATTKTKMVIYIIAGFFCLYIGMSISIFKGSYNGNLYFQAGTLLEILCFSLGLGYRIRLNDKEKRRAQEEVIVVQENANKQLESKVQERTEQLKQLNNTLNKKNGDLHASMRYAHKLQKGVLPYSERISQLFSQHFIVYRPRDIVSGDFYWVEEVEGKKIVVIADCTGHGIPGAMMSMLGSTALSDIILNKKILNADIILNNLSNVVEAILRADKNEIRDGMDIGVCVINYEEKQMEFAGAHHPLYYFQDGQLNIVKGTKLSIGGYQENKTFEENVIDISKETIFYMCSDGYQDQFGGPNDKKFMTRQLKSLLTEIHQMPLPQQKNILEDTLNRWITDGNTKQTDDILVWGAKI